MAVRKTKNESAIARARREHGYTQAQLAEAIGVTQQRITEWETGKRHPKMQALIRIGAALGVEWLTLIDPIQDETKPDSTGDDA